MDISFSKLLNNEANGILILCCSISIFLILISFIFSKHNLSKVFSLSVLSSLVCILYLLLDAPDVAMTEASIGACLSTVILLIFIQKIRSHKPESKICIMRHIFALCACAVVLIIFASLGPIIPEFGVNNTPIELGVSDYYVKNTAREIGIPAYVAAILASYRGFDTLGETIVILIAGVGVAIILGMKYERK